VVASVDLEAGRASPSQLSAVQPQPQILRPVEEPYDLERHRDGRAEDAVGRRRPGVTVLGGRQSDGRLAAAAGQRDGDRPAPERRRVVVHVLYATFREILPA